MLDETMVSVGSSTFLISIECKGDLKKNEQKPSNLNHDGITNRYGTGRSSNCLCPRGSLFRCLHFICNLNDQLHTWHPYWSNSRAQVECMALINRSLDLLFEFVIELGQSLLKFDGVGVDALIIGFVVCRLLHIRAKMHANQLTPIP